MARLEKNRGIAVNITIIKRVTKTSEEKKKKKHMKISLALSLFICLCPAPLIHLRLTKPITGEKYI